MHRSRRNAETRTPDPTASRPDRRSVLLGAGGALGTAAGVAGGVLGLPSASASPRRPDQASDRSRQARCSDVQSYRPAYHLSVPDNWKNDPQRPIFLNGEYLYYYLYNEDYLEGGHGTSWRLVTTTDHVAFSDQGVAIPKFSNDNGDCWSGSLVIDADNTAGYGDGAVIALVTQAPEGVQAQFLWYSTDDGRTFSPGPEAPVLPNPGVEAFRDPKVIWDAARSRWFMANAEGQRLGFYASADLHRWEEVGEFRREDIGLLECPDIFEMEASDGSRHWVLGTGANGKSRDLPATYAYWVGEFDGAAFTPDHDEPHWLDWGFDFYGAVTYASHTDDGDEDPTLRRAIGWANFWDYPHNTPSLVTDGYNGDDMIVREIRLAPDAHGGYQLLSTPASGLEDYTTATHALGDLTVSGHQDLDVAARAYELRCTLVWDPADPPANIGFELCRAPGGGRHVAAGLFFDGGFAYVNRRPTFSPGVGGESQTPIPGNSGEMDLRILVDHSSVECFFGDGAVVHSHRVFPLADDDGLRLFVHGGEATARGLTVRELAVP
ncbi:levanase [Nesterenkonia sp. PF2B19]|nr:levanase [Nesterenkonia sp. PF2B19]